MKDWLKINRRLVDASLGDGRLLVRPPRSDPLPKCQCCTHQSDQDRNSNGTRGAVTRSHLLFRRGAAKMVILSRRTIDITPNSFRVSVSVEVDCTPSVFVNVFEVGRNISIAAHFLEGFEVNSKTSKWKLLAKIDPHKQYCIR